jgi:hypothetical protein
MSASGNDLASPWDVWTDRLVALATRLAVVVALAASVATLIAVIQQARFAVPAADDFSRARIGEDQGWGAWWTFTKGSYLTWSGRWSGVGLAAAVLPRIDLHRDYGLVLAVVLATQLVGLAVLWRLLLGPGQRAAAAAATVVTAAIAWNRMPGPAESLYWFTGVAENQLPMTLVVLCVACMVALGRPGITPFARWGLAVLAAVLAVMVTGMHELYSLALWGFVAVDFAWAIRDRREGGAARGMVLALTTIGVAVLVLAPGNAVRSAEVARVAESLGHPIPAAKGERLVQTIRYIASQHRTTIPKWLLDPTLLGATVWFLLADRARRPSARVPGYLGPLALVAWAGLVAFWIFLPTWVLGGWIPDRTVGSSYTIFLAGWAANLVFWSRAGVLGEPTRPDRRLALLGLGAPLVLATGLLADGNLRTIYQEAKSGRAAAYRAAALERDIRTREEVEAGNEAVVWAPLPAVHPLAMDQGATDDPAHWANRLIASYYRLRSVSVALDNPDALPPVPSPATLPSAPVPPRLAPVIP